MMGLSSPGVIRRVAEIGQTEGSDADSLHAYCIRCHCVGWVRGCLGRPYSNGGDSSMVQDRLQGIVNVQGNPYAFAAVTEEGSLVTWGKATLGGDSSVIRESPASHTLFERVLCQC